jgi:hypothetical protein
MRSSDFGSIPSPIMLGGVGRGQPMARGGRAKAAPSHPHHLVIVAPSPIMGALMAAMLLHQAARNRQPRQGALHAALAKRKRR